MSKNWQNIIFVNCPRAIILGQSSNSNLSLAFSLALFSFLVYHIFFCRSYLHFSLKAIINKHILVQGNVVYLFYFPCREMRVIKLIKGLPYPNEGRCHIKITDYHDRALSKEAQGRVSDRVKDVPLPRRIGFSATYHLSYVLGNVA